MKPFFTIALLLFSLSSFAADCSELNDLWLRSYHRDLNVEWQVGDLDCTGPVFKFVEAVNILESTVFTPNPDGTKPDFYNYFKSYIKKVVYKAKHATFDYAAASSGDNVLFLHDLYFNETLEWRASTLLHEAHHNDPQDPKHEFCLQGANKDKFACDAQFFSGDSKGGSYNFDFNFYWWVLDSSKSSTLSKSILKSHMNGLLLNSFNGMDNEAVKKFSRY